MPIEIRMLAWSVVLGLVYLMVGASFSTGQRGLAWNAGNRDGQSAPLTGAAARAEQAFRNFMETFAFLAAAALAVVLTQRTSADTALGMQLFFWARVAYLPVYIIGIPYLRTLIWAVSLWGLLKVLLPLLGGA